MSRGRSTQFSSHKTLLLFPLLFLGESVKVNTEDERSSGDQAAAFSLPKLDVRLSSSGTPADDNVAEEETEEVIQRENTPPYTGLTGVRPISVAPIYAQLGSDNETSNDTYVNAGDIRFTGSLHET